MAVMQERAIHKAAAVIIRNRKLLLSRSKGKDVFTAPGGKLEPGETSLQALLRELNEEQGIVINPDKVSLLGTYRAVAAGHETERRKIEMDVYLVPAYAGEPTPHAEIAENLWFDSSMNGVEQGSIFEHEVIPELLRRNLID